MSNLMAIGASLFLGILLLSGVSYADKIEGIDYVTLKVNGKDWPCPVGNKDRLNEIYLVKKALAGDMDARDILLAGKESYFFFIGSDVPMWVKLTKKSQEIIK